MKASRVILVVVCLMTIVAVPTTARFVSSVSRPDLGDAVHITPVGTAPPESPVTARTPRPDRSDPGAEQIRPTVPSAGDDDDYDDDDYDDDDDVDDDDD